MKNIPTLNIMPMYALHIYVSYIAHHMTAHICHNCHMSLIYQAQKDGEAELANMATYCMVTPIKVPASLNFALKFRQ